MVTDSADNHGINFTVVTDSADSHGIDIIVVTVVAHSADDDHQYLLSYAGNTKCLRHMIVDVCRDAAGLYLLLVQAMKDGDSDGDDCTERTDRHAPGRD